MVTKKFWLFLAEHGFFTKGDHSICKVFFTGQSSGYEMGGHFVEADDWESAREALHAEVDKYIDHQLHMINLEKVGEQLRKKREEFKAKPAVPDNDIDSLSIGEFVGEPPAPDKSKTDGLLDLDSLL